MSVTKGDHDKPIACRCTQLKPDAEAKAKKPDQPEESILIRLIPSPGNDLRVRGLRTPLQRNEASHKSPTTGPSHRTTTIQSSTGLHVSNAGPSSQPLQWIPLSPYPGVAQGQQLLQVPFGPPLQTLQTVQFPQSPVYSTLMTQSFPPSTSVTGVANVVSSNEGHCCQSSHGQCGFTIPPYALSFLGDLYKGTAGSRPASPQGNNIRIKTTLGAEMRSKHKHRKHKHGRCSLEASSSSEVQEKKPTNTEVTNHMGYAPAPFVNGPENPAQEYPALELPSDAKPTDENPEEELQEKNDIGFFPCAVVIFVVGACILALLAIIFVPSLVDGLFGKGEHSLAWQKRNFREIITSILRKLVEEHLRATETASIDNDTTSVTMWTT